MFRLEFLIGESTLPRDMTVYQAVQQFGAPVINYEDENKFFFCCPIFLYFFPNSTKIIYTPEQKFINLTTCPGFQRNRG